MLVARSDLERISELYEQGLTLQAYVLSQTFAPLNEWQGTAARILAGRLASNLGALKLGRRLFVSAWRHDQADAQAQYYYARHLSDYRGPYASWRFLRKHDGLPDAAPQIQAEWLALHAAQLGRLRDFDAAEEWLARAEKIDPDNSWVCIERADLMEFEDRYPEALEAAFRSLSLRPWYRPGVQSAAHLLVLLDRDNEALELLTQASKQIESSGVVAQLAQLQIELGHFAEARQSLERYSELSPLMEPAVAQWWNGQLSDTAYHCGDYEKAAEYGELSKIPFYQNIAQRLRDSSTEARRVVLPVGFVRQHHLTCAPATLTTISRFWSMPADHLELAEKICYGGTTAYSERQWAEQNGWTACEFAVNWDDTVALIERGIAFTLSTVEPTSGHLQSVIGYDGRRGTMLIRDPYDRRQGEFAAEGMLEEYRATGPRGMALVPNDKKALFDGLVLNESALYDKLYEVQQALEAHERAKAYEIYRAMSADNEEHRLYVEARLALASYDADPTQSLTCSEKLLALFPDDANLKLLKLSCLRTLSRRSECIEFLKSICEQRGSHPLFLQYYARELIDDDRQHRKALSLLRRAARYRPLDAGNFYLLASISWTHQRRDEALELYRFAACLKDTDEKFVTAWFSASRHFHRTQEALSFLESRFNRFGRRSSLPARTLFWAYEQVGQMNEALRVLKSALELRPEDGDLLLAAADAEARYGNFETASSLLNDAQTRSHRALWLRTAAGIESYRGEPGSALLLWKEVLETEPLAIDANRSVARLLADTSGVEACLEFLREATTRFPHNYALQQLLVEWLHDDLPAAEAVLRHLIEIDPIDAWAHRELALTLCQQRQFKEGLVEGQLALQLEPTHPTAYYILGKIYADTGNTTEAKAAYREAIRWSVDAYYAIAELMFLCHSPAERRKALEFVEQQLVEQVIFGDGLLYYREQASVTLEPEEVRSTLSEALKARPDLWHAWSAMTQQLLTMQQLDEALELAVQATEKFPLSPTSWFDLSLVHRARRDQSAEIEALEQALRISPGWDKAVRQLAEAYQLYGESDKARSLLEQSLARAPLDPYNQGFLADVLWRSGEKQAALERIQRAVSLEPGYEWAWNALRVWSSALNCPQVAVQCARELTIKRAGEARSWMCLGKTLTDPQDLTERLSALERAIALNPLLVDAHCLLVDVLAENKRFDEAFAASRPAIFGDDLPVDLRSAAASIEAERGNVPEAIKQMQPLLDEEPSYFPGWIRLADWCSVAGEYGEAITAAQEMVRIAPQDAMSFGYLGATKLLNSDRDGAKEAFRYAMTLAPTYAYAGLMLFDLHVGDDDLSAADETLQSLREHVGGDDTVVRELRLAAKRKDLKMAETHLRQLCFSTEDSGHMETAAASMDEVGWERDVNRVLDEVLTQPRVNPQVGVLWMNRSFGRADVTKEFDKLTKNEELWRRTSITYLERLNGEGLLLQVRAFVSEYQKTIRGDSMIWGTVGWVLFERGDFRRALDWMSDWKSRADLAPWMLWNYVLCLRYLNRDTEAYEVGKQALLLPADNLSNVHKVFLALDEILAGDITAAEVRLNGLDISGLAPWQRFVHALASELLSFHQSPEKKSAAAETTKHLVRLAKESPFFRQDKLLIRVHRRSILHVAKVDSSLFARVRAIACLIWLNGLKL